MSETEKQVETGAPPYAVPSVQQPVVSEEPARLNAIQRLWGTLLSPGETFQDVNRKPSVLLPMIMLVGIALGGSLAFNWRVKPDWDHIFRAQIKKQVERSGQSLPEDQIEQRVAFSKKLVPIFPAFAVVITLIICFIAAGVFALGLMLIQAKTTFKKILSIVTWSYLATALVQTVVLVAALLVQDQETLNSIDPTQNVNIVPENLGAFLSTGTSPGIMSLASSIDIFTIWYLILLAVGFSAIAGAKRIKPSTTGGLVFGVWIVWVIIKFGWRSVFG